MAYIATLAFAVKIDVDDIHDMSDCLRVVKIDVGHLFAEKVHPNCLNLFIIEFVHSLDI